MQEMNISKGWHTLQDVYDSGEKRNIYQENWDPTTAYLQTFSDWELVDRLEHLQLIFSKTPYYGRELRHFNNAPWWYKNEFRVPDEMKAGHYALRFEGVDYYCKVWLNGNYLGEHEGYASPFEFEASKYLKPDAVNVLVVKVWSPWDAETLAIRDSGIDIGVDSIVRACDLSFTVNPKLRYNVILLLESASGKMLAKNAYSDAFNHPAHPAGHPINLDQELGMRLYGTRLNRPYDKL